MDSFLLGSAYSGFTAQRLWVKFKDFFGWSNSWMLPTAKIKITRSKNWNLQRERERKWCTFGVLMRRWRDRTMNCCWRSESQSHFSQTDWFFFSNWREEIFQQKKLKLLMNCGNWEGIWRVEERKRRLVYRYIEPGRLFEYRCQVWCGMALLNHHCFHHFIIFFKKFPFWLLFLDYHTNIFILININKMI